MIDNCLIFFILKLTELSPSGIDDIWVSPILYNLMFLNIHVRLCYSVFSSNDPFTY